jgi:competence protein ComEC
MFSWTPYALVRVAFVFAAGIVFALYFPERLPIHLVNGGVAVCMSLFTVVAYLKWRGNLKRFNAGLLGMIALLLAGYSNVYYSTDYHRVDHFMHAGDTITHYKILVANQAQEKENSWKVESEVQAVRYSNQGWSERSGKVLLYFSRKDFTKPFHYGDVLLIEGSPHVLKEPANPGEFDYKRFLTYKKIYHQHFIREGDVLKIAHEPSSTIVAYAITAREWADQVMQTYVHCKQEQATASALVLGVTDGLDNDLIGAYAATGALHVLAVSGLHVGIIYWLILLIFKPLNKTTTGKWTLAIFSILVLWGYAFITGLSPSVLRAVTMFSFVAIARPWNQRTNIYNTLAAAAFCLLLYEPYMIVSVGFQLSFLAVIGIVYVQPKLAQLWEPKTWLWDNIWQITCVSVAAQAATVALGLLYFHQFPVYFLFSNLFVIPVSFVVLVLGIVVVLISFISPVAMVLGFLLEWAIWFLNMGVLKMEALPFSLIDNVYITTAQCWLLMGAILCMVFLFELRKMSFFIAAAVYIVVFVSFQWIHFTDNIHQKKLTVYSVAGHSAWDIIENGHVYFFTDSVLQNDRDKIRFHIRPNRLRSGVGEISNGNEQAFTATRNGCRLVVCNGIRILHIEDKSTVLPANLSVDYVLLSKNARYNAKALSGVKFRKLILDSSNSFYFADRFLNDAQANGLAVHSVLHHGAFIAKL